MRLDQALLAWFDARKRDLPWRRDKDPYRVWISEIMLQQTQVSAVIPYYEAFLDRFPDVESLAEASVEEVLALWSGLGYYRRARQLHAAAKQVAQKGRFPATVESLLELPGIGAYTAAAVASIAFDVVVPVMDGNVERVMSRFLAESGDPKRGKTRSQLLAAAAGFLDQKRPGDGNQALMELGATLCRPKKADCPACPIARNCRARAEGSPENYPTPKAKRERKKVSLAFAVACETDQGWDEKQMDGEVRLLLFRRPDSSDLMAGLWEIPNIPLAGLRRMESALARTYGGRWRLGSSLGKVHHAVTYRDLEISLFEASVEDEDWIAEGPVEAAWVSGAELDRFPTSSMVSKALAKIGVFR